MSDALEKRLLRAVRRILRPVVRIMIRNGITALAIQELLRKEFVDAAFEEFQLPNKVQTSSRVAVITGLNRKEVTRLRKLPPLDESDQVWRNQAAGVISSWAVDPQFQDSKGDPLDLPFDDASPSFCELVQKQSGDMQPRAIADELIRNGALQLVEGRLHMTRRGYVPVDDPAAMVDMLGTDTAELVNTIDHNLGAIGEPLLQAKVLAENVSEEHVEEFVRYSKRLSRNLLDDLTIWLTERDDGADFSGDSRRYELGLGIYQILQETRGDPAGEGLDQETVK